MPQMSPLMWTSLFMFFTIIMILFVLMNFFMKNYFPNKKSFYMNKKIINWKW
uniref:ATP synthase F0 subunit 8 n=1 Tax=Chrysochares punctatus TaxID=2741024 RepID=A0A890CGR2_9CUCU|nr:ATP synthase F0 subunit 8 [Chrysochares punctatus]